MKTNNNIINSVMKNIVTFAIEAKKYLFAVLLLIGTSNCAWATTETLNFAKCDWGFSTSDYEWDYYSADGYAIEAYAVKMQYYLGNYNGILLDKNGGYIILPPINGTISRIDVTAISGASLNANLSLYVNGEIVGSAHNIGNTSTYWSGLNLASGTVVKLQNDDDNGGERTQIASVTITHSGSQQGGTSIPTGNYGISTRAYPAGAGIISSNATYAEAWDEITLSANPASGYQFKEWEVTYTSDCSAPTYLGSGYWINDNSFYMPGGKVTVVGIFEEAECSETLSDPTGLSASFASATTATFSWNAVNHASSYMIAIEGDGEYYNIIDGLTGTSYTATDLSDGLGAYYTLSVQAIGDGVTYCNSSTVDEIFEAVVATHTLAIAAPANVTISSTTPVLDEGQSSGVSDGTMVTLSYSNVTGGYAWAGWNVYKTGDPTTTVSVSGSNQFTMPNYDVTVDASLYQKSKLQTRCQAEVEFTIEGSVYLTSYAAVPVYTTDNPDNRITVTCADFGTADRLTITYMKNGEAVAKGNSLFRLCGTDYNVVDGTNDYISVSGTAYASGQKFVIRYTPEAGVYDRTDTYTLRLTAQNGSTPLGYQDIVLNGRALPEKFVIAAQINGQWCALPADLATSSGTAIQDAYPITVNNDVTAAIAAPKTAIYSAAARNNATKHRGGVRLNTVTGSNDGHLQAPRSNDLTYLWRTSNNCSTGMQEWYLTSSDLQIYNIGVDPNIYVSSGSGGDDDTEGSTSTLLNRYLCVYGNKIMWTSSVTPAHREFRILPVTNEYEPVEMQVVEWKADGIKFMYFGNPEYTAEVEIEGVNKASAQALGSALQIDHGVYEIAVSDLKGSAYKQMNIIIKNGGTEVGRKAVTIPLIVNTETTIESARSTAGITVKANCSNVDLVVLNGGKLSSAENTDASQFTFKSITVYGGGKLIVPAGNYLTAKKMYLRAGSVTATTKGTTPATSYSYVYPQVYVGSGSTLTINENIINFDYLTNYDQYFGVAFPHAAAINKNNITYPDDIYGSAAKTGSYLLRVFDSQIRANQGAVDNVWVDVETGSEAMPKQTNTIRGLGYYALFPPRKVSVNGYDAERQKYGIQRVKMSAESLSNEYADATIDVTAYPAEQPYNAGWWMLGNPYMANLNGGGVGDSNAAILVGKIGKNAQGQYEWQDKEVRYVTVPNDDASETYDQRPVSSYTFPAFKPFYVQVGANGRVTFTTTNRVVAAPSRFFNNEMPTEIETAIALNSEAYGDTTHILINNEFTAEYEVGDDLLKMPHANVSLFTISGTTDLFANALNAQLAAEGIPVGYTAPTEGQYTFSYNDKLSTAWIEHLWLIDYVQNSTTDLLESDYTFNATAETNKTRFVLKIELKSGKEDPTTSIDGLIETSPNEGPIKFIYQDKLYIRYNGIIYDAVGKKVSEIK